MFVGMPEPKAEKAQGQSPTRAAVEARELGKEIEELEQKLKPP